jgi:hypothetical protein
MWIYFHSHHMLFLARLLRVQHALIGTADVQYCEPRMGEVREYIGSTFLA